MRTMELLGKSNSIKVIRKRRMIEIRMKILICPSLLSFREGLRKLIKQIPIRSLIIISP